MSVIALRSRTRGATRLALLALVLATNAVPGPAQTHHRLDLTSLPAEDELAAFEADRATPAESINVTASHTPSPALPLRVIAVALDQSAYVETDELVFEITILNSGHEPVEFPWARRTDFVRTVSKELLASAVTATLAVTAKAKGADPRVVCAVELSGSPSAPGTLLVIGPGESATVRASGRWSGFGAAADLEVTPTKLAVGAELRIRKGSRSGDHRPARSERGVTVDIRRVAPKPPEGLVVRRTP